MANTKAGPKDMDVAFMTEAEADEAFANAKLNHMRIMVSTALQDWCNHRVPKLFDLFCKTHYNNMREFCKETVNDEHEPDYKQLLLDGFQVFFGTYHAHTKRCPFEVQEDVQTLAARLTMNYYTRVLETGQRSLTLFADLLPPNVAEQTELSNKYHGTRCTHEFELNLLH